MQTEYDVIVVGAGIHGAGVAQAAAAAGHRVMVLEQTAPAAGTSSRSSKLVHGGLRYLESGQFGLVRKSLQERAILLRVAPKLVSLVPFLIPVYASSTRSAWKIRVGLSLYALLGGLKKSNRFNVIHRAQWPELAPLLTDNLRTVFRYWDAQTDDEALTGAVIDSARRLGASLLCPAQFLSAEIKSDSVRVDYAMGDQRQTVSSRTLVNATGPWVNQVLELMRPKTDGLAVDLVQGTHLVIDHPAPASVFYVEAPQDQRAVFVMPWRGKTLVGTTETIFHGDPAAVQPLPEEIEYLLSVWQHYFPTAGSEVLESFAGLRVLPRTESSFFHRARETVFHCSADAPHVLTLYGGKLTGYRATAESVMIQLAPLLPSVQRKADTRSLRLGRGTRDE